MLRPLAQDDPESTDILFLIGLAAIEESQRPGIAEADRDALLDEGISALNTILIDSPSLVRVRLELARAFFLKGEDSLARRNFELVLAGEGLPPAVAANIGRFLSEIRARRRWDMHFGMAMAPDSNVGATSDERIIYVFGLPFERDAESLKKSGVGISVWGGGEYQYPLGGAAVAPRRVRRLAAGIRGERLRPVFGGGPFRAAMADVRQHGGEPAGQRPPGLDPHGARPSRCRRANRDGTPAHPAGGGERPCVLASP